MNLLSQLLARWQSPMPTFFDSIHKYSLVLLTITGFVAAIQTQLSTLTPHLPNWLLTIFSVASTVTALVTKLTVDGDAKAVEKKLSES